MSPWLTQALASVSALPTTTPPGGESRWETFFQLLDNEMEHGSGASNPTGITKELLADADAIGSALTGAQTGGATGATGATGGTGGSTGSTGSTGAATTASRST